MIREMKTGRYTKRRLDDTRYSKKLTNKRGHTRKQQRDDTRRGKLQ